MKKIFILAGLLTLSAPLLAHHGNASVENKTVVMKGTVTEWLWTNPHTFLKFDVKDESGNVKHWTAGVAKSGAPIGRLKSVLLPDGILMTEDESVGK